MELFNTQRRRWLRLSAVATALWFVSTESALTGKSNDDDKAVSFHQRVADAVTLTDDVQLRGVLLVRKPVVLLVRSEWLKSKQPAFLKEIIEPLVADAVAKAPNGLAELMKAEIKRLSSDPEKHRPRIAFLKETLGDLAPEPGTLPALMILEIPAGRVRRVDEQPQKRKRFGQLAVLNSLSDFEELDAATVEARLADLKSNLITETPAEVDPTMELRAILAAADVQLDSVSRLVRNGDSIVDESQPLDPAVMLQSMLGGGLESVLSDLLNEGSPAANSSEATSSLPHDATQIADQAGHDSLVLSDFQFELESGSASVTRQLFTRSADGNWIQQPVIVGSAQATRDDLTAEQVESLRNDPQVKQISGTMKALGIDGSKLDTAISMGAVVQSALKKADATFQQRVQSVLSRDRLANRNLVRVKLPR